MNICKPCSQVGERNEAIGYIIEKSGPKEKKIFICSSCQREMEKRGVTVHMKERKEKSTSSVS